MRRNEGFRGMSGRRRWWWWVRFGFEGMRSFWLKDDGGGW